MNTKSENQNKKIEIAHRAKIFTFLFCTGWIIFGFVFIVVVEFENPFI